MRERLAKALNEVAWREALYDPKARAWLFQAVLVVAVALLFWEIATNTAANLAKQNIASGFGFLQRSAGFDVSQSLIPYTSKSSYTAAFFVGLFNTLLVSVLGIALATLLGFGLGIARLSSNWLVAKLALAYVEIVRNVPLLLQLLIWYVAVLRALPSPHESLALGFSSFLDVRGLHLARPEFPGGAWPLMAALVAFCVGTWLLVRRARALKAETGADVPVVPISAGLGLGLLAAALVMSGLPRFELPQLGRFNFEGGLTIEPEFLALLLGLSTYTAAFIAEIVRGGLVAVPRGQWEAAQALGLKRSDALRLVIVPQALRIIIPPLTNQYLNLTKNSSLAVAIGYPDLVSVFSGTVLNQTGQAVEVILITMGVYLTLSLAMAAFMNWFNRRMALVER